MTRWRVAAAVTIAIAAAPITPAAADAPTSTPPTKIKLKLAHELPLPRLRMRRRSAAVTPAARTTRTTGTTSTPTTPSPSAPRPPALTMTPRRDAPRDDSPTDAIGIREPGQAVAFRMNLGYVVDGNEPTGRPSLTGQLPGVAPSDTVAVRSYGFGEIYGSTHGVGVESVSTYLAARFILSDNKTVTSPVDGKSVPVEAPIATWFDRNTYEIRSGWAEAKDFMPEAWLAPLRVRAGRQYVYGPWVVHMDGANAAWQGKIFSGQIYAGTTVPDYLTVGEVATRAAVAGVSARVDLRGLQAAIPIAIGVEGLRLGGHDNGQLEVDWRPRRDFALIGESRTLDGQLANEHVQFRGHYKQVSNLVIDVSRRFASDWRWDPTQVGPDDPASPRQYLQLGPVLPNVLASIRAGTVIADNIDLLIRGAASADLSDANTPKSSFSASYLEIGGALEVRLRRTVAVGASFLNRDTNRTDQTIVDLPGIAQVLPLSSSIGEDGFTEIGTSMRLSFGARKFSATLELYGRRTRYAPIYALPTDSPDGPIPTSDIRGGGRVSVDAWIGDRLRLFAAYDLSSSFAFAPESTGYKSLKLMIEGVY